MSISNQSNISQVLQDIAMVNRNASSFDKLSKQLSTGKKHESLREYGSYVSKIINLQGVVSTRESYIRAIDLVSFNIEAYQETLAEIDGLTRDAFKASGEAPPNSQDPVELESWRNTLSNTTDLLLRQFEAVLNTNIGDKYIFSGNQYQSPAVKDLTNLQTFSYKDAQSPEIKQVQTLNNLPQGAVNFAVGELTKTVTVQINGDVEAETNPEQFKFHLSDVTPTDSTQPASKIVESDAMASVMDNDTTFSIVNQGANSLAEGGTFSFVVKRKGGDINTGATVNLTGLNGVDVDSSDFAAGFPPSALTFAAGETEKVITVQSNDDSTIENAEHFLVQIAQNVGVYHVDKNAHTASATINDNDDIKAYLSVARTSAASINEDDATAHTFTITRDNSSVQEKPQQVKWEVDLEKSTADAVDFGGIVPSGTVTFLPGETSKTVTVYVNNDQKIEGDETFQIKIDGANVIQSHAEATIANDEVSFGVKPLDANKLEGGNHSYVVTRSGDASVASTLDVDAIYLSDGSAVGNQTVNFAAGETQKVVTFASAGRTADDTMRVSISNPNTAGYNSYIESYAASADGQVIDSTSASGTVSVANITPGATVVEGDLGVTQTMTFEITRTDATREEYVSYNVQDVNQDSTDSKDFLRGYGTVPTISATDASGASSEFTYIYNKVAGERDPLVWEQQSVGLRDGETRNYGVSAADPAFQKLIKGLILLKSAAEDRNIGNEKVMLDAARDIITEAVSEVRQLTAANAITVASISTTKNGHISFNALAKNKLNSITDIDPAEAAAKVTSLQSMVNASYSLIAKRAKMSLANFL